MARGQIQRTEDEMIIRYANKSDWEQMRQVFNRSFPDSSPLFVGSLWVVAEMEHRIVGIGSLICFNTNNKGMIGDLATLPEFRHRGCATQIVDKLINTAFANDVKVIEVISSSTYSQNIVERKGFKQEGVYWRLHENNN